MEEPMLYDEKNEHRSRRRRQDQTWNWLQILSAVSNAALCTVLLGVYRNSLTPSRSDPRYNNHGLNTELKRLSSYSPILDQIEMGNMLAHLDGSFYNNTSIYRQAGSPAVDQAWKFFDADIILIPAETVRKVGKDPSVSVQIPPEYQASKNEDKYLATFDVFHQIHCLNTLREEISYPSTFMTDPSLPAGMKLAHRNHCMHMLLQSILCHADTDLVTYEWAYFEDQNTGEKRYTPWADFGIFKTCRNFDGLYEWAQRNRPEFSDELRGTIRKPESTPARNVVDT